MIRTRVLLALATAIIAWNSTPCSADTTGIVFVDANENGVRDPGELGRAGITVSNGVDVARTNVYGRYTLPERPGFVMVTCPDQFDCPLRYRELPGDFPIRPSPNPGEFFFIQISDAHVFENVGDFADFSQPVPDWVPRRVGAWLMLRGMRQLFGMEGGSVVEHLRAALSPHRDIRGMSDLGIVATYFEELLKPASGLERIADSARDAMAEIAALDPTFVVSTGDLVLEANRGSPDAIASWFRFYEEITTATGISFYNTIGNNEIAGIESDAFPADDPRYGKHFFRQFYGPTHYSFDRGNFHFVALDTHRPDPTFANPKHWTFVEMEPDVREWLDADLRAHPGMVYVALNHEPFHSSSDWPPGLERANDEGAFAEHGIQYSLAGHVHFNGFERRNGTTHITTGSLSGGRWVLPADLHERGYRLFYAKDGGLYHAWKRTGHPLIAFLGPQQPQLAQGEFIAVAVDRYGAFANVDISVDGATVAFERWGEYFFRITLPYPAERIVITATSANGETRSAATAP